MTPPDESQILAGLRKGDSAAFTRVLEIFGPRLLATATRMMGSEHDGQDVLQEAMVSCFKHIGNFKGESALYTWLHRVTVTAALMKLRTRKRRNEAAIEPLLPTFHEDGHRVESTRHEWAESSESLAQREEMRQIVRSCIDQLPESYRTVLLLRDIEEWDTAETAEALGVAQGVVKTRLHRARQALRTLLEPYIIQRPLTSSSQ